MAASGGWVEYGLWLYWLMVDFEQWLVAMGYGGGFCIYLFFSIYIVGVFKVILMCCICYFNVLKDKIENLMYGVQ